MAKQLKLKARKFWVLTPTFVEGAMEELVGENFYLPASILNRVNNAKKGEGVHVFLDFADSSWSGLNISSLEIFAPVLQIVDWWAFKIM